MCSSPPWFVTGSRGQSVLGDGALTEWPSCPSSARGGKIALFGHKKNLNYEHSLKVPVMDDAKKASINGNLLERICVS